MRSAKLALLVACFLLQGQAASADSSANSSAGALAAFRASESAAQDIWDKMPMAARRVIFASAPVKQYGAYEPRGDNIFKDGEKVVTYIEPVGFVFRDVGDGVLAYGFKVDLLAKKSDGKTLLDKHDYATLDSRTRSRKQEVEFDSSLDIKGIGAGTYSLEFTFHDLNSAKTMVVKQTFQVTD